MGADLALGVARRHATGFRLLGRRAQRHPEQNAAALDLSLEISATWTSYCLARNVACRELTLIDACLQAKPLFGLAFSGSLGFLRGVIALRPAGSRSGALGCDRAYPEG